jgi:ubiquinone/menaquinone biosynthesis C-methylase UbiE
LELAKKGYRVIATDVSERALADARAFVRERGAEDQMAFLAADGERLPFGDATFDGCLIAASLHHLPHPIEGLREMRRVVKPGGVIVAAVEPNAWPYYTLYPLLAPVKKLIRARRKRGINSVADDHTKGFTQGQLKKLFAAAGLKVEKVLATKFTGELYDSGMRMVGGLTRQRIKPILTIQRVLARFDEYVGRTPIIRNLAWHWTVVARVGEEKSPSRN